MKKDYNDDHHFLPTEPGEGDFDDEVTCEDPDVDMVSMIEDFCEGFEYDQKIRFLKELGFNILSRKDKRTGDTFDVAYDPAEKERKKLPRESNIDEKFVRGISDCILKILLKYGK